MLRRHLHADYAELLAQDESQPRYKFTGCGAGMLSNRISWFFDLQATSVTVDIACSSPLVALRLGCQSIRTGDADMVRIPQRVQRNYFYYPAYIQK